MPRSNPIQTSFNSGEISPRALARVDIAQYPNAAETAKNLLALPQGGFARRPGSRYVAEVKDSSLRTILLPFQFSTTQAYQVEAGNNYFRFYRNQGQIFADDTDASITNGGFDSGITSWTDQSTGAAAISHDATNLRLNLDGSGSDTAHAEQTVTVSETFEDNDHVIRFSVYGSPGDKVKLRIGTTSTGNEIIDDFEVGVGHHTKEFIPGTLTFYVQFLHAEGKTISIDNVSLLDNVPVEVLTPYATANIDSIKTAQSADVMYMCAGGTIPVYKLQRTGHLSWSVEQVFFEDGPYLDENAETTTLTASATTGKGITITASATTGINGGQGFLSTDVDRLIRIQHTTNEPGYAIITGVTSTTIVTADVKRDFNATTASEKWRLGDWSATTGYPAATTFFEQRLAFAGTNNEPQSFWFSQSASLENFRPDSFVSAAVAIEDDDALDFTIAARELNAIRWMSAEKVLVMGTSGGEWIVTSDGPTITPTDISVKRHSNNGCADIQPLLINDSTVFVQRARRKIFSYRFEFANDRFQATDITIISDHITRSGINRIEYQQQPDSLAWCARDDGQIATVTYNANEGVSGWTRTVLGGSFGSGDAVVESISIIPGDSGGGRTYDSDERDEVWCVVKRTINGATVRYVEFFEGLFEGPLRHDYASDSAWKTAMIAAQEDAFYVDSGLTYDGVSTTTLSGLDHLEGETVKILADGAIHPDKTVSGGAITLDYAVTKAQVGLGYTHEFKSIKLNSGAAAGTAVGKIKRIHGVTFVLMDTATFQFGPTLDALQTMEFREVGDAMDTAVPLFTGEKYKDFGGEYNRDARFYIQSDNPSPFYLLALAPELKTNEML